MKSLQHHVQKLAELMRQADLVERKKAAKLIKKAEERARKIRKRCQQNKNERVARWMRAGEVWTPSLKNRDGPDLQLGSTL